MKINALLISILFLFIFTCGCSMPAKPRHDTWLDISRISQKIVKNKEQPALLDAAQAGEKAGAVPDAKNISADPTGGNPYMSDIVMQQLTHRPAPPPAGGLLLNFDNADIYEFIQAVADALNLDYIVEPKVKGTVNIRSRQEIPADQLFAVFKKILSMNGLDIQDEGKYYYIFKSKKPSSALIYKADRVAELTASPRMIMQVMPIMHLSSKEVTKLIEPYLSEQGTVYDLAGQNTIIIADYETNVIDALMILSKLDVSPLASLKMRLIKVKKAGLFKLYGELDEILSATHVNKKNHDGVSVLPLERLSSLLLLGNSEYLLQNTEKWIKELDVVPSTGRDNIYIYNVRNSEATELANLVESLISAKGAAGKTSRPPTKSTKKTAKIKKSRTSVSASYNGLKFAGAPLLVADDSRNAILIRALPADYSRLVKLLERLDTLPRQVLIEVLVAEVTLNDNWSLGIEWALSNNKVRLFNDSDISGATSKPRGFDPLNYPHDFFVNSAGIFSTVSDSEKFLALLKTFANDSKLSILSSPQVMVLNNETATVNVGDQVPIVTTETVLDAGATTVVNSDGTTSATNRIDRNVQYRDTGIILTVTPRINYNGVIILDIDQQVSKAGENTLSNISSPSISNRQIKTKLTVKDGQSILMGGLISKDVSRSDNGIPLLKDIPLLGWLFKSQSETTRKTELMIMITPHVIESENVLDQYVVEFKKKINGLRKKLAE